MLAASFTFASDFSGHIVSILDGDTIEVLHNSHAERIRLNESTAERRPKPTASEPSKPHQTSPLGKKSPSRPIHDKYKHTIGDVLLSDSTNANHTLAKDGWCWWYRKYAPEDTVLEGLENDARAGRKGLWADPHPVPPWEWRKRTR